MRRDYVSISLELHTYTHLLTLDLSRLDYDSPKIYKDSF